MMPQDNSSSNAVAGSAGSEIAVLIPCLNEEMTVGKVVQDFRRELPHAEIYVFDNNSEDRTREEAKLAGATVRSEWRLGKGFVVRSMFQKIEADVYVLVDGDDTYPAQAVHSLVAPILANEADMVVGTRLEKGNRSQLKTPNRLGNRLFVLILNLFFGVHLTDILSGYRTFCRSFVKDVPIYSGGFEIEAELTIKAVQHSFRIVEVPVDLKQRPEGSESKINLVRDGVLILTTIMVLFRDYKPLTFFGISGLILFLAGMASLAVGSVGDQTFQQALLLSSTLLAAGLILASLLAISIGIILHTVDRRFQELEFHMKSMARRYAELDNE